MWNQEGEGFGTPKNDEERKPRTKERKKEKQRDGEITSSERGSRIGEKEGHLRKDQMKDECCANEHAARSFPL